VALDPRTPVIVGVGQLTQRTEEGDLASEPVDMIVQAARRAAEDSGSAKILSSLNRVAVVPMLSWRYADPGALVAERLGLGRVQTVRGGIGGHIPLPLLVHAANDISAGHLDVALVAGAEAWRTRTAADRAGQALEWTTQPEGTAPDVVVGGRLSMSHEGEKDRDIRAPIQVYPLFENALRAAAGRSAAEHSRHLGELWARFSQVALTNPYAWYSQAYTADEIATPSPGNRMVGFPYTKLMSSNEQVDQAAAVLICSVDQAEALGVPRDRWVFPHSVVEGHAPFVSERIDLSSSPTVRAVGGLLWELTGTGPDDIAHVDLYSCFPSAVQVQAAELGFALDRQLTLTGGMRFAGGPWNNYATHSLATLVEVLRNDPASLGLCAANGGFISKSAIGIFSTTPPAAGFRAGSPQAELDAGPRRQLDAEPSGAGKLESFTVMHDRTGGATDAILACLMPDGRRAWGRLTDPLSMDALSTEDVVGRSVTLSPDGQATID
jgi:acetyl-CoA C-acetyltransferase